MSLETTFRTGVLASMLTPEIRHLMELPSPISPTVDLFPAHEKSQDHQVSPVDLVDSEQLLTPDGAIHPLQKLGGLGQAVSNFPYVKCAEEASPTTEPVFKNNQVPIETIDTLKAELDTPEQALTVSVTGPAVQDAAAPLLISATSEQPLESERSAFTIDEESEHPSILEESQTFGHIDEWVMCVVGSYLKLIISAGILNSRAFADLLSSPVNLTWILSSKIQVYLHKGGKQSKEPPETTALAGSCKGCRMELAPLLLMVQD